MIAQSNAKSCAEKLPPDAQAVYGNKSQGAIRTPMSDTQQPDRRNDSRVTIDLWVEERTEDALYFQRATNLSPGGLFLERTLAHAPGTLVEIDLRFPGDSVPMRVKGEVVPSGSRELGMGLRFVELSDAAKGRINDYLRHAPFRIDAKA